MLYSSVHIQMALGAGIDVRAKRLGTWFYSSREEEHDEDFNIVSEQNKGCSTFVSFEHEDNSVLNGDRGNGDVHFTLTVAHMKSSNKQINRESADGVKFADWMFRGEWGKLSHQVSWATHLNSTKKSRRKDDMIMSSIVWSHSKYLLHLNALQIHLVVVKFQGKKKFCSYF